MKICLRNESLVTLVSCVTLRSESRFENYSIANTLPGKLLTCHYVMMDCHCFRGLLYVGVGSNWALPKLLSYITICLRKKFLATTHETSWNPQISDLGRDLKIRSPPLIREFQEWHGTRFNVKLSCSTLPEPEPIHDLNQHTATLHNTGSPSFWCGITISWQEDLWV